MVYSSPETGSLRAPHPPAEKIFSDFRDVNVVVFIAISCYSQTSVHELNSFVKVVRKPKCS